MELPSSRTNRTAWIFLIVTIFLALLLTVPVLSNISPHSDEHQFFLNAWSIMGGKPLHNYLHVALTEYALAGFLVLANILTPSGVNFPQGDPSPVTYFFGRVFGLLLYFLTFAIGAAILQSGQTKIRIRTLIFAVLYFASLGVFERFLRINSDSMSVFVALNYLYLSLRFHKRQASLLAFFALDTAFVFLGSFTNLKSLYLVLPIFGYNVLQKLRAARREEDESEKFHKLYRLIFSVIALVVSCVILWYLLIPKPVDPRTFWYNIKNATVRGVNFDFEYPSQSYRSWLFYLYDFVVEYLGLGQFLILLVLLAAAFTFKGRFSLSFLYGRLRFQIRQFFAGEGSDDLRSAGLFVLVAAFYYLGIARVVVHWSRWGLPLAVFAFLFMSQLLEPVLLFLHNRLGKRLLIWVVLFVFCWTLRGTLFLDILKSNYPERDGFRRTYADVDRLAQEKGVAPENMKKEIAWFTGYTNNVSSLSLEQLVDGEGREVKYLLWPYWNIGLLYTPRAVDKFTHNQRAFVDKYAEDVSFRFPSILSRYMHETKLFAWRHLGLTWNPEIDSLVETQYAVLKLKKIEPPISFTYAVIDGDLAHYYSTDSPIFNFKNLFETYILPACATHPDVRRVASGEVVPAPPALSQNGIGGKTAGLNCHSLWFRVFLRGKYLIRFEGLPTDLNGEQLVYSTMPYLWDPATKSLYTSIDQTRISAEFGVALREESVPGLKALVYYESIPKPAEATGSARPKSESP